VSFYDELLLELLTALGAALFIGNLVALVRRRRDRETATARPGKTGSGSDLPEAPLARTVLYLALGFVVMIWGIASLVAG
jgi:hypothetical protein